VTSQAALVQCDLEGRITAFGPALADALRMSDEQRRERTRVHTLFPGREVLRSLPRWLDEARRTGETTARTVLVRGDRSLVVAEVRFVAEPGGFRLEPTLHPSLPAVLPRLELATRLKAWATIVRLPFLTASAVPVIIGGAWAHAVEGARPFPWAVWTLAFVGALLMQAAANAFNDYFDWRSGADRLNTGYFNPFSGGSRCIELGLVTERGLWWVSSALLGTAALLGIVLVLVRGWGIVAFGLVGAFSVYFYTAPPLKLAARKGLGELVLGLNFGPLIVAGTVYAVTGAFRPASLYAGLPVGLLTTAILWINEIPDAPSDVQAGKHHLVSVLGARWASWAYAGLLVTALLSVVAGVVAGLFPLWTLLATVTTPLGVWAARHAVRHHSDRSLVRANAMTNKLQLVAGSLFVVGLLV